MHRLMFNLLIISCLCFSSLFPQVPKLINYQGFINSAGEPLNGSYEIKFSLLDQPTEGTYLWAETQTVSFNEGNFNVLLGSVNELDESLFLSNRLFLEIKIGSETLEPRVQLTSVAYSLLSKSVEFGSIESQHIIDGAITQAKLSEEINLSFEGPAGGDLSGDFPNPTVGKLQGKPVSNNNPLTGQVLKWDGTQWKPDSDIVGDTSSTNLTVTSRLIGDGSVSNPLDIAQQDATTGQVLKWDGTQWKPSDDISEIGTSGGDITAVIAGHGLADGGVSGDVTLNIGAGNGIIVNENNIELDKTYTDGLYVNKNQASSITSAMIVDGQIQNADISANAINSSKIVDNSITTNDIIPNIISSIKGVSVDGGNIDLIGSNGISISATQNNSITFTGTGSVGGDNLGDHFATQNIKLNGNYLSGDGANEGIYVSSNGNIGINANISDLLYDLELGDKDDLNTYFRLHSKSWGGLLFYDASITAKTYCGGISYGFADDALYFDTKDPNTNLPSSKMIISSDGKVGIGRQDLVYRLEIGDPSESSNHIKLNSKNWGGLLFWDGSSSPTNKTFSGGISYGFSTNSLYLDTKLPGGDPITKMIITGEGKVGIGTENPSRKLSVNGDAGGTTSWNVDSDERLKTNIRNIDKPIEKVLGLNGVYFNWKDTETHSEGNQMGFIAQDAIDVVPEVVDKKGEYYSMQYGPINALLVEAIKEQQEIIEKLETRIKALESTNEN